MKISRLVCVILILLAGCTDNVAVKEGGIASKEVGGIASPTIVTPSTTPYYSSDSVLTISGWCEAGAVVVTTGDATERAVCVNYSYTLEIPKDEDGIFQISVIQIRDSEESRPVSLIWYKKSSVAEPALSFPSIDPFFSAQGVLTIEGSCETGAVITLDRDAVGETTCVDSEFSIEVPKFEDGDYKIRVIQTDQAENRAQVEFVWKKRALVVDPNDPQVIVDQQITLEIEGGTNVYTTELIENNSGSTYDPDTYLYQAGLIAGVTDVIRVTDTLGAESLIEVTTIPDDPDHFILPSDSGNEQTQIIGLQLDAPIKAQVVDQYGNGVPNFEVMFQLVSGDVEFLDAPIQSTDAEGKISMNILAGYSHARSIVRVLPLDNVLPDVAESEDPTIELSVSTSTTNSRNFGLAFTAGSNPDDALTFDYNGDGHQDVVILNTGESTIGLFPGDGSGLMGNMTKIIGLCSGPSDMKAAELNGDEYIDLMVICSGSDKLAFVQGGPNGAFQFPVQSDMDLAANLPVDLDIGDFNMDGELDLAIASIGAGAVAIKTGNGDGTFNAATLETVGTAPSALAKGDMDKAGGLDVVAVNSADETISILLNNGGFAPEIVLPTGTAPSDVAVADVNGDGFGDVIVANNGDSTVGVYLNDQVGGFNLPILTNVGINPNSLHVTEITGDSSVDLVTSNSGDSTVTILEGQGDGNFDVEGINTRPNPVSVASADFNNDMLIDLVSISNGDQKIEIFPSQATGIFGMKTAVGSGAIQVGVGDLDKDGNLDQITVNNSASTLSVLRGNGQGLFEHWMDLTTGSGPAAIKVVDLNTDGNLDILVTCENANQLRYFPGLGAAGFDSPSDYATGSQPAGITTNDFNGDGILDVAIATSGANSIGIFLGEGNGVLGSRSDKPSGAQPADLRSADFNGDEYIDLAVANESGGNVSIFLGNGNGSFQDKQDYNANPGTNSIVVGLLNSDDNVDVAVANEFSGTVSVLTGNGDGSLNAAVNYSSGLSPKTLQMGDFNGDLFPDLIVGNGISQTLTVLYGSPFGDYSSTEVINAGINNAGLGVGDFNGDGGLDISILDGLQSLVHLLVGH